MTMPAGKSVYQADNDLYEQASRETANLCCLWLKTHGHKQAAKDLAEYLNQPDIVTCEQVPVSDTDNFVDL